MSLATTIVYSLFYVMGNSAIPYVPEGADMAVRYDTEEGCKAVLVDMKKLQNERTASMMDRKLTAQERSDYDATALRLRTMSCEAIEIDMPPATQAAKPTSVPALAASSVLWKIGRIDKSNIFHGTEYNEYAYNEEEGCKTAYENTKPVVFNRALADGSGNVQAADILAQWTAKYSCNMVSLKPSEVIRAPSAKQEQSAGTTKSATPIAQQPVAAIAPSGQSPVLEQLLMQSQFLTQAQMAQSQLQQQQIATLQQQVSAPAPAIMAQPQYAPQPYPMMQQGYAQNAYPQRGYPIRPVYIAEMVRDPYGSSNQYVYPTPYGTLAECWNAVNQMFGSMPSDRRSSAQCVFAAR